MFAKRPLLFAVATLALAAALLLPARAAEKDEPHDDDAAAPVGELNLPPAAERKVDFSDDVQPILEASCAECHSGKKRKGGFSVDSRESVVKGGESGPAVVAHDSANSLLIRLVVSADEDERMPQDGDRLTDEQVGLLRAWIDQGVPWEGAGSAKKVYVAPIAPRQVEVPVAPEGSGLTNPVDLILQPYYEKRGVEPAELVSDAVYARRVYMDVIGLLPSPGEVEAFVADDRPDKRERLVDELLSDSRRYAENFLSFWNDALRNDYAGTGYIDGGRKQITRWLYGALLENMPYDDFVRELVAPTSEESEGFVRGIIWRGAVSASQTREIQAAQNVMQVFMGLNFKCNACHDSFISDWKLEDAYALAGVYSEQAPMEMYRCEMPTGEKAEVAFPFPELGTIDSAAPRAQRIQQLGEIITSPQNGRLTRTIVNRLWARFMGRGVVEPVDEMDNAPWSEDLLDWLAVDLAENGYDLKHTIRRILTSRAYQRPAVGAKGASEDEYVFRGPLVRRMSAEQFCDAVSTLTGVWRPTAATDVFSVTTGEPVPAKWIWNDPNAAAGTGAEKVYFRTVIEVPGELEAARAVVSVDNIYTLFVNGQKAGAGEEWNQPGVVDVTRLLKPGKNVVAVAAENIQPEQANPAGLWALLSVRLSGGDGKPLEFGTDATWQWSRKPAEGWNADADFAADGWHAASELGDMNAAPWNLGGFLGDVSNFTLRPSENRIRAVWTNNDALMTALGRPNREQVMTSRPSHATMLQALELTNGPTLNRLLQQGAGNWLNRQHASAEDLVSDIFQSGLGRKPTKQELADTVALVGEPVQREGVEDLLWAMLMLPEFQLIY